LAAIKACGPFSDLEFFHGAEAQGSMCEQGDCDDAVRLFTKALERSQEGGQPGDTSRPLVQTRRLGPFAQAGLDEGLCLAVRLWSIEVDFDLFPHLLHLLLHGRARGGQSAAGHRLHDRRLVWPVRAERNTACRGGAAQPGSDPDIGLAGTAGSSSATQHRRCAGQIAEGVLEDDRG